MAQIKVRIDKNGDAHIEVDGVEGSSCTDLTSALVQALGHEEESSLKPEHFVDLVEQTVSED